MPDQHARPGAATGRATRLTGWGRVEPTIARVTEPAATADVAGLLAAAPPRGVVAGGLGRSYNNAAQNNGGWVIATSRLRRIAEFEPAAGTVTCEAGVSLEQLM